ncbi:hypothetical protein [Streptomyces sp. bgisy034]|uniref:hypothetical protein n=1 Tax=Streptomyces sp. bgisy034 TaxID=3413774 RepID=UPI003EBA0121
MTHPHSIIAAVKTIASDARFSEWDHPTMRDVDRALSYMGGLLFAPTDRQRANLCAWVTATDDRIGTGEHGTDADPFGFLPVAAEVAQLTDDELTGRYQDRRRTVDHSRYDVRDAHQIPTTERPLMADSFQAAAEALAPGEAERASNYADAARALRAAPTPEGFVIWDRLNHMYVINVHCTDRTEAAAEAVRLNRRHRATYVPHMWA